MLVSDCRTIVAAENAGCDGGVVTGAQDAAVTLQLSAMTDGPGCVGGSAAVGAVGEFEQPIANSNMSPPSVRVTTASLSRRGARCSY